MTVDDNQIVATWKYSIVTAFTYINDLDLLKSCKDVQTKLVTEYHKRTNKSNLQRKAV